MSEEGPVIITEQELIDAIERPETLDEMEKAENQEKTLTAEIKMEIKEAKKVWVAWTNTDRTEGRGRRIPKAVCSEKATAIRMGKKGCVQGGDCAITEEFAVRLGNGAGWLIPGIIHYPTTEDKTVQHKLDEKEAVLKKAKDAGLTDKDILLLGG